MLLAEERFRDFITGDIVDANQATEVLTCLSADSREAIDERSPRPWTPAAGRGSPSRTSTPTMYGHSFQDLDGHVWELMHMEQQ